MWSCPIEILGVGTQDTMQMLFAEDQYVIQALSSHTPQKAFTDRIGARCMFSDKFGFPSDKIRQRPEQ
jgi:hypothetical protein